MRIEKVHTFKMFALDILDDSAPKITEHSNENISYSSINVNEMKLWKLLTRVLAHLTIEFPVLHPSRSNVIFILAIPSFLSDEDACIFINNVALSEHKVTIVNSMFRSAIIEFESQGGADRFYINTLGEPFDPNHPHIKCISLFLLEVTPDIGIHPIPTHEANCSRDITLPLCPICFQCFDPLISTLFMPSTIDDISPSTIEEWGGSNCIICNTIYSENAEKLKCSSCDITSKLWICMECGHVGCGREQNQHAILHYKETHHRFALRFDIKWLWDYIADKSVDRPFSEHLTEANDEVVHSYRQKLLEGMSNLQERNEELLNKIHYQFQPELDALNKELQELTEIEEKIDPEYQEVVNIDNKIAEAEQEIKDISNSPEMENYDQVAKQNSHLKNVLKEMDTKIEKLYQVLDHRIDVSDDVTLTINNS